MSSTPQETSGFSCPFCQFSAGTERSVRQHITREDDAAHRGRDGFAVTLAIESPANHETLAESTPDDDGTMSFTAITPTLPVTTFEKPDSYYDLTPTQQDIVDAILENPADTASNWIEAAGCSEPTLYNNKRDITNVVDEMLAISADEFLELGYGQRKTAVALFKEPSESAAGLASMAGIDAGTARKFFQNHNDVAQEIRDYLDETAEEDADDADPASTPAEETEPEVFEADNGVASFSGPALDMSMQHISERPVTVESPEDDVQFPDSETEEALLDVRGHAVAIREQSTREYEMTESSLAAGKLLTAERLIAQIDDQLEGLDE